jgi:hypothetical protein
METKTQKIEIVVSPGAFGTQVVVDFHSIGKLPPGSVTMNVKIDMREFRVRSTVGMWLIKLGARVIGLGVRVDPPDYKGGWPPLAKPMPPMPEPPPPPPNDTRTGGL